MLHKKFVSNLFVALLLLVTDSFAQWINDPNSNTKLVVDPVDPVNISAVTDLKGGAFIFWQDKKSNLNSDIYFIHFNQNGQVSFRADGKSVTINNYPKENPVVISEPNGNAIVIWKETNDKKNSDLYIQKVTKTGLRLWNTSGIKLTDLQSEKIDYDISTDKYGISFISFTERSTQALNKYSVRFLKLNLNGKLINDSSKSLVVNSVNKLSQTKVIPDDKGGAFICWLETLNNKLTLFAQYIDSTGSKRWGSKPLTVSKKKSNVISYSVSRIKSNLYLAITYQGANKQVYQQLVSDKGNLLWGDTGKLLTYQKGSQTNPQISVVDSNFVVSWTNESEKVKEVYIQKFNNNAKGLWSNNGLRIKKIKGNQFGQRIISDKNGNTIIAWIDNRENNSSADLYIQKIDPKGKFVWNPDGVKISSSENMQKSYLNLVSDQNGGAIAVFKGTLDGINNIYGQKIFNTGTYASQVIGFNADLSGDSVLISWYAANETEDTKYIIQRSANLSNDENDWENINTISTEQENETNYYKYIDFPSISGSIYYRILQNNSSNKILTSAPVKVDYFANSESIILGQNSPNPFSKSTTIPFYLPKEEFVTLEIFNSNIETVDKIENKKFSAGKNSYVFNSKGLEPGIYFYRLKVDDFVDVKKMILIQ